MTESYDPYRNAMAERVNGILKQEFITVKERVSISGMKKIVSESLKALIFTITSDRIIHAL